MVDSICILECSAWLLTTDLRTCRNWTSSVEVTGRVYDLRRQHMKEGLLSCGWQIRGAILKCTRLMVKSLEEMRGELALVLVE